MISSLKLLLNKLRELVEYYKRLKAQLCLEIQMDRILNRQRKQLNRIKSKFIKSRKLLFSETKINKEFKLRKKVIYKMYHRVLIFK